MSVGGLKRLSNGKYARVYAGVIRIHQVQEREVLLVNTGKAWHMEHLL